MLRSLLHIAVGCITLCLTLAPAAARAEENDDISRSLGLAAEEPATFFRFPRPASKVAENVTVITADDIARVNAHTLADVLQTVPGVQLDEVGTPGTFSFFSVLGTTTRHVQLLIDGVPQNFLSSDNTADPGSIPVQMIDRVEIVKGAASAAWGSALGGVISVFTKSPNRERKLGGTVSASLGERSTTDARAEVSGTVDRFGYYLTGGEIHSKGLNPGNGTTLDHAFAKFSYHLPAGGNLTLGIDVRDNAPGQLRSTEYDVYGKGTMRNQTGWLSFTQPLDERLALQLQVAGGERSLSTQQGLLSQPVVLVEGSIKEIFRSAKAGLSWGDSEKNLNVGAEYEHVRMSQDFQIFTGAVSDFAAPMERYAAYLNGTYTIGRLSVLPGYRYDRTTIVDDAHSYTLGATLRLTDSTILRAYAARGYSLPAFNSEEIFNSNPQLQNVKTAQVGVETSAIPYLWVKGTVFYNDVWKVQTFRRTQQTIEADLQELVSKGIDAEIRTYPIHGVALSAAYTYSDSRDKETDAELTGNAGPREGLKLGVNYDNSAIGTSAALTGNKTYWHLPESVFTAKLSAMIWDLHLTQKLMPLRDLSPEIFFSLRNIFNDDQYQVDIRPNTPRWIEGGLRYRF